MNNSKQGNLEFSLKWQSKQALHNERVYMPRMNFWRDYFPGSLGDKLGQMEPGETTSESFEPGSLVDSFNKNKIYTFPKRKLNLEKLAERGVLFRQGRFYPRSELARLGFAASDKRPFRLLENREEQIVIDINHPLQSFPMEVSVTFLEGLADRFERGGSCNDVVLALTEHGPGMQASSEKTSTDFYSDQPFTRLDEKEDQLFYHEPRLVDHIDSVARNQLAALYGRFLKPGSKVLDLMAGWNSHLSAKDEGTEITGLGMNQEELQQNQELKEHVLQDLNSNPALTFAENQFDLAVCSLSVEYLTNPVAVFKEINRVLKPGSPFVVVFSDRWFPQKAIQIWTELHAFERIALVLDYFDQSGGFQNLNTESIRGYSRPHTDPYFGQRRESDPLFAVWGVATK